MDRQSSYPLLYIKDVFLFNKFKCNLVVKATIYITNRDVLLIVTIVTIVLLLFLLLLSLLLKTIYWKNLQK